MFDVQKYAQLVSIGYLLNRICFNAATSIDKFQEVGADFIHLSMCVLGVIVGGFFGSLSQLTWIISLSTIFTSIKSLIALSDYDKTLAYYLTVLIEIVSFFFARVIFFYTAVFLKIVEMVGYRFENFWATYDPTMKPYCQVFIGLYLAVYVLNLNEFSWLVQDLFEMVGLAEAVRKTERADEPSEEKKNE